MWFRVRHTLYALFFCWTAYSAWSYSSIRPRPDDLSQYDHNKWEHYIRYAAPQKTVSTPSHATLPANVKIDPPAAVFQAAPRQAIQPPLPPSGGPGVKVRAPATDPDMWWQEVLAIKKPETRAGRDATVSKLAERKAKLEKDKESANQREKKNEEWLTAETRQKEELAALEKKQKDEADERERKIAYLHLQIAVLQDQKPDYAGLAINGVSALCAVLGVWLAWLTYRGPNRARISGPPPLPSR